MKRYGTRRKNYLKNCSVFETFSLYVLYLSGWYKNNGSLLFLLLRLLLLLLNCYSSCCVDWWSSSRSYLVTHTRKHNTRWLVQVSNNYLNNGAQNFELMIRNNFSTKTNDY